MAWALAGPALALLFLWTFRLWPTAPARLVVKVAGVALLSLSPLPAARRRRHQRPIARRDPRRGVPRRRARRAGQDLAPLHAFPRIRARDGRGRRARVGSGGHAVPGRRGRRRFHGRDRRRVRTRPAALAQPRAPRPRARRGRDCRCRCHRRRPARGAHGRRGPRRRLAPLQPVQRDLRHRGRARPRRATPLAAAPRLARRRRRGRSVVHRRGRHRGRVLDRDPRVALAGVGGVRLLHRRGRGVHRIGAAVDLRARRGGSRESPRPSWGPSPASTGPGRSASPRFLHRRRSRAR